MKKTTNGAEATSDEITCPRCSQSFQLTSVMRAGIHADLKKEHEAALRRAVAEHDAQHATVLATMKKEHAALRTQSQKLEEAFRVSEGDAERRVAEAVTKARRDTEKQLRERAERDKHEALLAKDAELADAAAKLTAAAKQAAAFALKSRQLEDVCRSLELEAEKKLVVEREKIREQFEGESRERVARATSEATRLKNVELADATAKLTAAAKEAAAFALKSRQLEDVCRSLELEAEKKLVAERENIRKQFEGESRERVARATAEATRLKDVELADAHERLAKTHEAEAALTRRNCELEDAQRQTQRELEARVRESGELVRAQVEAEAATQRALLEAERDLRIREANAKIAELQQKLSQGSQQSQGEAQEIVLRDLVIGAFTRDEITEVAVGAHGADLAHVIRDETGRDAATILWESKRTKHWSNEWLPKLRDDMRASGAACAILVTNALPHGVATFGEVDGIWVCSPTYAVGVARIIRAGLLEVAAARRAEHGRTDKMHLLYRYLTGPEFKSRLSGALEAFREMQTALDREQKAIRRSWHQRAAQIERAIENLTAFYGDVRGIAGRDVATLEQLEFDVPALAPARSDDEVVPELVELFFALIPADRAVGNITLREQVREAAADRLAVDVTDADYEHCRGTLLASGRILLGRGRGGSVTRAPIAEAAAE